MLIIHERSFVETIGPGDDQVNMKLEGNGAAGWSSWTKTHLLTVCTWICCSCSQRRNVFSFKAPVTTTSFLTTNAVNLLSGV